MTIHTKPLPPSSQKRLERWAHALRNRHVRAFHWRLIGDERLGPSIDRRLNAEWRRGNFPGDVINAIEHEFGRGVEYRTAIELCVKIERTDEYRERYEAREKAHWCKMLSELWSKSYVPLTACAYFVATNGEPAEPDDDALETAAAELVELLQAEKLTLYGKRNDDAFRQPISLDNIRDATEDGAPIYGGSSPGKAPRLTWAIITDDGEDVIQNRDGILWKALAVKKADLLALLATTHDHGAPDEPPAAGEPSEAEHVSNEPSPLESALIIERSIQPGRGASPIITDEERRSSQVTKAITAYLRRNFPNSPPPMSNPALRDRILRDVLDLESFDLATLRKALRLVYDDPKDS
jgi:hypothetical protein